MTARTERVGYEEYTYSTKTKVNANEDVVTEYQKVVAEKIEELSQKLQNGETETSYQIGAQSFTEQEWNKLMEEYDYMQDEVKKLMRERYEQLDEKRQVMKEEQEKHYEDEISEEQVKLLLEDKTEILLKPLRPVDNWLEIVKRPLPVANKSMVDIPNNSVDIAVGTKIAIHDGYILTVKSDRVEVSKMGKPSEAYQSYAMAHSMAQTLEVLLRNAGGMICDVARDKATWERWDINVSKLLKYIGIDVTKDFTVNGTTYTENQDGYMESEVSLAYKDAFKNQNDYVTEEEMAGLSLVVDENGNARIESTGKLSSFSTIGYYEEFYKKFTLCL